jgi:hypothetical protein
MGSPTIGWEEASDIFTQFCRFVDEPEMRWFKKAWQGFVDAGKTSYENDVQKQWVLARAVTLGVMFAEFAEKAWGENSDTESDLLELSGYRDTFNLVRLGNMADKDFLSDDGDESDLFVEAMDNLVYRCRREVYDMLVKVFGHPTTVFVSLWLCLDGDVEVGYYSDELFESTVNHDMTPQKLDAFDYVINGMFGRDA